MENARLYNPISYINKKNDKSEQEQDVLREPIRFIFTPEQMREHDEKLLKEQEKVFREKYDEFRRRIQENLSGFGKLNTNFDNMMNGKI